MENAVECVAPDLRGQVALDPGLHAGHSPWSESPTSTARSRASDIPLADQSWHKSIDVLRMYVRSEERFEDRAAEGFGAQNRLALRRLESLLP